MTRSRREWLPGWRAGILILGLYAMFLQAFVGALAGPAYAPGHSAAFAEAGVICADGGASAPAADEAPGAPHKEHACVCPAMCHAAGALPTGGPVLAVRLPPSSGGPPRDAATLAPHAAARFMPPARAPPHAGFVLHS